MHHKRLIVVTLAIAALAVAPTLAGAQSVTARPAAITATHAASVSAVPKFIFHAGLAFGAFHHFIYLPFKAGKFTSGSFLSKLKNYVEAGAAALFVYHETKLALQDAQQNKVLKLVVAPLTAVVAVLNTIVSKVKAHNLDAATITTAQSDVTTIEAQAKRSGSSVSEAVPCQSFRQASRPTWREPLGAGTVFSMMQSSAMSSAKLAGSCSRNAALNRLMTSAVFSD